MTIQLKTNPTDKVIELGGGSHPLVRPNVDVRICHDEQGNRTVDFTADFHQPLPIQSNEWDGVFSQFAIEHIAYPKVPQFIAEVFRILKPGGKAVIVTANTHAQINWTLVNQGGWDGKDLFEAASCKLFGDQRHGEREGDPNPNYDSHKCYFSPAILIWLFTNAGFEDIKVTPYGARDTDIVVEAVKPGAKGAVAEWPEGAMCATSGFLSQTVRDQQVSLDTKTLVGGEAFNRALQHLASLPENQDPEVNKAIEKAIHGDPTAPNPQGIIDVSKFPWLSPDVEGSGLPQSEPVHLEAKKIEAKIRVHPDSPFARMTEEEAVFWEKRNRAEAEAMGKDPDRLILGDGLKADEVDESDMRTVKWDKEQSAHLRVRLASVERSYQPEKLFNREYFNGGAYKPFYWDYPCHELTARHVLSRKPESVLELGCGRGYVLKRLQDAGVMAKGIDVSKHCHMTRVVEGILQADFTGPLTWGGEKHADLCFSIAVLDHIPEEHLPAVFAEMERTCKRGLHGINFGPAGDDKTRVTIHPKEWWQLRLPRGHEVVDKNELEAGHFPEDVFRGDGKIKLNLGCAQTMFHHGWDNIDIHDLQQWAQGHGYRYQRLDLRNGIPWGTGGVDLIYCGHMLEHLTYKEGLTFLRDCRRVLKPDGAMRIIVPDAGLLTRAYGEWDMTLGGATVPNLSDFDEVNDGCANAPTTAGKLWALLHEGHQAAYDAETLMQLLEEAGFRGYKSEFRKVPFSATPQDESTKQILRETLDTHPALSLYMDAVPRVG